MSIETITLRACTAQALLHSWHQNAPLNRVNNRHERRPSRTSRLPCVAQPAPPSSLNHSRQQARQAPFLQECDRITMVKGVQAARRLSAAAHPAYAVHPCLSPHSISMRTVWSQLVKSAFCSQVEGTLT